MNFSIAQETRSGARRYNEDRIVHFATSDALLMVVADGMGGHVRGDVAAQVAVDTLLREFQREATPKLSDPTSFLFRGLAHAHGAIVQEANRLDLPETPRTVAVACVVQEGYMHWTHVGDSRLYLIRRGRVAARTKDHSRVQQLIDRGQIREDAALAHPERNVLTRCLGGEHAPAIAATTSARLVQHDVIVLCSDGFWGPLADKQLIYGLRNGELQNAISDLAALAEAKAGAKCDNLSVIAMVWGEGERAPADEPFTLPFHDLPTESRDMTEAEADYMRMSDEDIEREISEIKAALRKHSDGK